jgi:hypothetical protein
VTSSGTNTVAADGSTLTINGDGSNNGITVNSGANAFPVSTPVVLGNSGANQTWTNNSANLFTANGTITGTAMAGNTQTLTLVNSNTGGTTIGGLPGPITARPGILRTWKALGWMNKSDLFFR